MPHVNGKEGIPIFLRKTYIKQNKNKNNMSYAHDDGWRLVRYGRRGRSCQQLPFSDPRMRQERRYGGMEHAFPALPMGEPLPSDRWPSKFDNNHYNPTLKEFTEITACMLFGEIKTQGKKQYTWYNPNV